MKRRLLLALGTLVVLLAGFAAYYVVSRDTLTVRQTFTPGEPQTAGGLGLLSAGVTRYYPDRR